MSMPPARREQSCCRVMSMINWLNSDATGLPMSSHRAVLLGLALLTFIQVANAEPIPMLAYVAAKDVNPKRLDIFKKGLAELGYVEERNIRIEYREAVLDTDYHGVITELIARGSAPGSQIIRIPGLQAGPLGGGTSIGTEILLAQKPLWPAGR